MGFRFRKSIKLAPGIKLNLSKSGISTTIGRRGASINLGKKGAYLNAGIPGTGISARTKIGGSTTGASSRPSMGGAYSGAARPAGWRSPGRNGFAAGFFVWLLIGAFGALLQMRFRAVAAFAPAVALVVGIVAGRLVAVRIREDNQKLLNVENEGATVASDLSPCEVCGHQISSSAVMCPNCGHPLAAYHDLMGAARPVASSKSKTLAAMLALFLGGLGIHKFYLGRTGWGILYLLFCWTFIPAIVSFVEAIILFATSEESFARKYG